MVISSNLYNVLLYFSGLPCYDWEGEMRRTRKDIYSISRENCQHHFNLAQAILVNSLVFFDYLSISQIAKSKFFYFSQGAVPMQEILGLVRRCVTDYDMIQEGETVAVGVSGGKDSLVTLTVLARLSKFYQKPFKVVAITVETGVPGMSFDAVADYCAALGVEYIRVNVPIYEIVFLERKEKNPCSLCAKLRRGALSTAMNEHGIKTIALGHHYDDAVETLLMNLLFEGRIGCFQPVTYLSRSDVTQIRPLLYVKEQQVRNVAAKLDLPIVHNPCPANGETRRQEVKELIKSLSERYPDLKQKLFGAMQRYPLYGWDTKNSEK